ncbi:M28 family peptidase [Pontibacter qinzhouensis]|uniref:M28 family peptidase n=1 Tax=Pontibacter qinzhouensis TaxID=2603253 RepID=A0A5C8IZ53_9BACT|nr:M28 family peptidase [Pontibacter qinzhouensis]TXK26205.1 M28 family peptidase [Pontibacter qinzhouensis]
MKSCILLLSLLFLLQLSSTRAQTLEVPRNVHKSLQKTKADAIKSHIAYLADDRLQGRLPGTEGYQLAVDYVIEKFKALNVEPAGENNTYLQQVRLRRSTTDTALASLIQAEGAAETLTTGRDFIVYPHPEQQQAAVEAPLVFAGFGISAPDLGYDDYANLDVTGKMVVVLRGAPANFPSTVSSYSTDLMTILQTAADHGAVGVIVSSSNPNSILPNLQRGVNSVMQADGKVAFSRTFVSDQIKVLAYISHSTLQRLLKPAKLDATVAAVSLRSGITASATLPATMAFEYSSSHTDFDSYNVIGRIPGTDLELRQEYVVHSAHLDHMGISTPVNGDSIYNGAHDNASGVASLLEIAQVYSRLKQKHKPKRSVLIVMVTAEEMGLLGSAYFAKFPTVPKDQIVANINTDMPTIIAPLLSVVPLGAIHSSLQEPVAQASAYLKLAVEEDPEPEQNRFIRSDQYSFVVQGIPALHIKYGNKTPDGQNNLHVLVQEWRAKYYHKPQDDINGIFDFEAGKTYVQLNFLIGYQVAQNPQRPTWNTGDFFGERFGRK